MIRALVREFIGIIVLILMLVLYFLSLRNSAVEVMAVLSQ